MPTVNAAAAVPELCTLTGSAVESAPFREVSPFFIFLRLAGFVATNRRRGWLGPQGGIVGRELLDEDEFWLVIMSRYSACRMMGVLSSPIRSCW
jgi:hypothetical protein